MNVLLPRKNNKYTEVLWENWHGLRPDMANDTLDLAGYGKNATVKNLRLLEKVVKKAKKTSVEVKYSRIGSLDNLKILAISDGGLNRREDRTQSIMGEIIFLSSLDDKKVSPLLWKSKSIRQVCKSAKTAETRSCEKTLEDAVYLARSLKEIYTGDRGKINYQSK